MSTKTIQVLAEEMVKLATGNTGCPNADVTYSGKITKVLPDNKYDVNIKGTVFTVPSVLSDIYSVGDLVLITYVQNDNKRRYITGKIGAGLGSSAPVGGSYLNLKDQPSINGVTLVGDKTVEQIGAVDTKYALTNQEILDIVNAQGG